MSSVFSLKKRPLRGLQVFSIFLLQSINSIGGSFRNGQFQQWHLGVPEGQAASVARSGALWFEDFVLDFLQPQFYQLQKKIKNCKREKK